MPGLRLGDDDSQQDEAFRWGRPGPSCSEHEGVAGPGGLAQEGLPWKRGGRLWSPAHPAGETGPGQGGAPVVGSEALGQVWARQTGVEGTEPAVQVPSPGVPPGPLVLSPCRLEGL